MTDNELIDDKSPMPLYHQVYLALSKRIRDGEFAGETPLPAERRLVEAYSVSRSTVIKAIDQLCHEGIVEKRQGSGTFVLAPKLDFDPTGQSTFSDYLQRQGIDAQWTILRRYQVELPDTVLQEHPATLGQPLFCASAVLGEKDQAIAHYQIYVPVADYTKAGGDNLSDEDLLVFMRQYPQGRQLKVERSFEAVAADRLVAERLSVKPGQATQLLDLKFINSNGRVVQLIRSYFRGDRLRYTL
ncbi:MAG: GntR family transcriptional regulator [Pseudomonadales bacterium]